MISSVLTKKGQVTIPKQIRQKLDLQAGDKVGFVLENNDVVLFKKINDVSAAFGLFRASTSASLEEMEIATRKK